MPPLMRRGGSRREGIERLRSACRATAPGGRTGFVAPLLPRSPQASRRIRPKIYVFKGAIIGPNSR
jgi:hypothetical protein